MCAPATHGRATLNRTGTQLQPAISPMSVFQSTLLRQGRDRFRLRTSLTPSSLKENRINCVGQHKWRRHFPRPLQNALNFVAFDAACPQVRWDFMTHRLQAADQSPLEPLPMPRGRAALSVLPRLRDALAGGAPILPVPADDPSRAQLLFSSQRAGEPIEADIALVACTSGSTGEPKGAMLSAANLAASADATHTRLGGPGQWLLATPADHIAGVQVLARSLRAGFEPVILDIENGFDPALLPQAIGSMTGPRR